MVFNERIVALREKKGITQKQCAADLKVDYTKYNRWERGVYRPDYEMLVKMADYFDCTTDYLLGVSSVPTFDHADIAARTGLSEGAITILEQAQSDSWQRSKPIIRALNLLIEQRADLEKHLMYLISIYLYYELDGETPFRTTDGDPVHTVDLTYRDNEKSNTSIGSVLRMNARDIVGMKILDALRDLSQEKG